MKQDKRERIRKQRVKKHNSSVMTRRALSWCSLKPGIWHCNNNPGQTMQCGVPGASCVNFVHGDNGVSSCMAYQGSRDYDQWPECKKETSHNTFSN